MSIKQAVEQFRIVEKRGDRLPLFELAQVYQELRLLAKGYSLKMRPLHDTAKRERRAARLRQ